MDFKKITNNISKAFAGLGRGGGQSFVSWMMSGFRVRDRAQLLEEYKNIAYAAITTIAEDVAQYEPLIKNGDKLVDVHPFLDVLRNPNPYTSQFDFFEQTQTYLELCGEAFWYFQIGEQTKKPKFVELIRPDRVEVVINDETGDVLGYKLKKSNGTEIALEVEEVWHIKRFNPLNPYRGLGTVQAGILYLDLDNNLSDFQNNFIKNQATPSGVVALKGKIDREAFNKLKKQWKEEQSGTKNAGKTLFIREADASFTKVGLSLAELNIEGLSDLTEEKILKIFRVPKALLGVTDSNGLGRANVEAIEYIFAKRTIEPKLIKLDNVIEMVIKRFYGQILEISHKSQIPEDEKAKVEYWNIAADRWLTRNEIRAQQGMAKMEGGDNLFVEFNKMPLDSDMSISESEKQVKKKIVVKASHKHDHTAKKDYSVVKEESRRSYYELLRRIEDRGLKQYRAELRKYLDQQKGRVLEKIRETYKSSRKRLSRKQFEDIASLLEQGREALILDLANKLIQTIERAGLAGLEYVEEPDLQFIISQAIRDAIFGQTERQLKSFDQQTALKIQKQLAAGIANRETVEELATRIESIYSESKGFRSLRIAKTENHKVVNEGVTEAYRQAGFSRVTWVAIPPSCEFCEQLNGTTVAIGSSFVGLGSTILGADGGEFTNNYSDIRWADMHPNCDCKLEPERG